MPGRRVHDRGVDLVGEHPPAVGLDDLAQRDELVPFVDATERVVRVAQHDEVAVAGERPGDALEVEAVGAVVIGHHRHLDDLAVVVAGNHEERHVRRRRQDDGAARAGVQLDRHLEPADHVGQGVHPLGGDVPAVRRALPRCAGLGHRRRQRRRQVAEGHRVDGLVQGRRDGGGRAKIHLGHEGADDVALEAAPLETAGRPQPVDGDGVERSRLGHHR